MNCFKKCENVGHKTTACRHRQQEAEAAVGVDDDMEWCVPGSVLSEAATVGSSVSSK